MRNKLLPFLILVFISKVGLCQLDSLKSPLLEISFNSGVLFTSNDDFLNTYNSKSHYIQGFDLTLGKTSWRILPVFSYTSCKIETDLLPESEDSEVINTERTQIVFGLMTPVRLSKDNFFRLKYGLSYNYLSEQVTELESKAFGILISCGYMRKLTKGISYFVDMHYDYVKVKEVNQFNDWSGFRVSTGIGFNLRQKKTQNR